MPSFCCFVHQISYLLRELFEVEVSHEPGVELVNFRNDLGDNVFVQLLRCALQQLTLSLNHLLCCLLHRLDALWSEFPSWCQSQCLAHFSADCFDEVLNYSPIEAVILLIFLHS